MLVAGNTTSLSRRVAMGVLVVLMLTASSVSIAMYFVTMQHRLLRAHADERRALEIVVLLRAIDGQDWRVDAGEELEAAQENIGVLGTELLDRLGPEWGSADGAQLDLRARMYLSGLRAEFRALQSGDLDAADKVEYETADPAFVTAIALATSIASDKAQTARQIDRTQGVITWVSTVVTGVLVGGGWAIIARTRRRRRDSQRIDAVSRQFRSLVESSPDVITIVRGAEQLTLMSGSLSFLSGLTTFEAPRIVSELLPPEAVEIWSAADLLLTTEGGHVQREMTIRRHDLTLLWVELNGSLLVDRPTERVWIWHDISYRKELELQLTHQAFHDALTGVANRSLLIDRTTHALNISNRSGAPVSLLFCDLDDFKTVNDTLGHEKGDELLNLITSRIVSCVREIDTVARLGGDEFAVLLEDADANRALELASRVLRLVSDEATIGGHTFFPSMSIGVATALPGMSTDELLRNADLAMYSAKNSGKGRSAIFQDQMHETTSELLQLQTDLKVAIAQGQLCLHYQPTIDLDTGTVEGVEALIRWQHPTLGNIPPDRFIPLAEATGMIIAIGRWVLHEACRAAVELLEQHSGSLLMHVNVAPQQLLDPTFVDEVKTALARSGLAPQALVLEVTEGVLLDSAIGVERLHEINALGVLIAIDDFGTGYTSLNYLQRLPVQILKIDRSFVSGGALHSGERNAFLQAIVGLAKGLEFRTVAEGIEEAGQLAELKGLGCNAGQGWLWAKAASLEDTHGVIQQLEAAAATQAADKVA